MSSTFRIFMQSFSLLTGTGPARPLPCRLMMSTPLITTRSPRRYGQWTAGARLLGCRSRQAASTRWRRFPVCTCRIPASRTRATCTMIANLAGRCLPGIGRLPSWTLQPAITAWHRCRACKRHHPGMTMLATGFL